MSRFLMTPTESGKIRILFGTAAAKERRRIGRRIDEVIAKAFAGELEESDRAEVENLAANAAAFADR